MTKPDERAFPLGGLIGHNLGLTKREWFAGLAMQGCISAGTMEGHEIIIPDSQAVAEAAIKYADALIAELGKEKP